MTCCRAGFFHPDRAIGESDATVCFGVAGFWHRTFGRTGSERPVCHHCTSADPVSRTSGDRLQRPVLAVLRRLARMDESPALDWLNADAIVTFMWPRRIESRDAA